MSKEKARALAEYAAARLGAADEAAMISDHLLDAGAKKLDRLFGAGYAKANPALLGQYLAAAADIFQTDVSNVSDFDDFDLDLPLPDLDRRR